MEIKINREIRDYTEAIFFGLSLRQFLFSLLALAAALTVYFALKPYCGTELVTWLCVLAAAPFALLGFVRASGLPAERFALAWLRYAFVVPRILTFRSENIYFAALAPLFERRRRR